jgi:predicted kinase
VVFGDTRPGAVVVTTPNAEYNALFPNLAAGTFRHPDHRFEWTRAEFRAWADRIGSTYGYRSAFSGIGRQDEALGTPTQMAVFTPMSTPDKNIEIPDFSLIVLIGSTGSGKSTFAAKHFLPTEVISSDYCRALVSDSETDQDVTGDAFDLAREIAGKRLKHRKLAVIDATNVRPADRKGWIALARQWHALPVAIVFDPGIDVCIERNKTRPDRAVILRYGGEDRHQRRSPQPGGSGLRAIRSCNRRIRKVRQYPASVERRRGGHVENGLAALSPLQCARRRTLGFGMDSGRVLSWQAWIRHQYGCP